MYIFIFAIDGGNYGPPLTTRPHVPRSDLLPLPPAEPEPLGLEEGLQPDEAGPPRPRRLAAAILKGTVEGWS